MYESFGFDTITVVASPVAVVDATIRMYDEVDDDDDKREGDGNNRVTTTRRKYQKGGEAVVNASSLRTMDDYAWKILNDIHESIILTCPGKVTNNFFIFHAFSNGGCFVWESVCRIFDNAINKFHSSKMNEHETKPPRHKDLRLALELSSRCRGVVFDSCPAWFGSQPFKLWMALQHVMGTTKESGPEAAEAGGMNNVSSLLDGLSSQLGVEKHRITTLDDSTRDRNLQYFDYLRGNSSPSSTSPPPTRNINGTSSGRKGKKNSIVSSFPQLYLYSKDDPLTDYEYVQSIIDNNRQKGMVVFEKCWTDSIHCGHLKEHPNEYRAAVVELLQLITKQSKI